ncbi:photosystem II biogenesis protein Psp29 [Baaleninema sp.]|uniref:photosystem II biogenesis protein Psp29 n=1 Tax=Baaleninema sp. TaxID=3101197 RepID=UPI003CFF8DD4
MDNVRTVSDTKRAFYRLHTRPVNSIYRRVVEELMVEMHLLSVNVDFKYDPIYALGVVTAFDRLMRGYQPDRDRKSIFESLCRAIDDDPDRYRQDAAAVTAAAEQLSSEDLTAMLASPDSSETDNLVKQKLQEISSRDNFKYSRLFAIGLLSVIERVDEELAKDDKKLFSLLEKASDALNLSDNRLQKDLELYRSNLEKMEQAQSVMADILAAERKKRSERENAKQAPAEKTTPESQSS